MKKNKTYLVLLLCVLLGGVLQAQNNFSNYQQTFDISNFIVNHNEDTGDVQITITNNTLQIVSNESFSDSPLEVGRVQYIANSESLPNISLGNIQLSDGTPTSYEVLLKDNWIEVHSNVHEVVSSLLLNFVLDLTSYTPYPISLVTNDVALTENENYVRTMFSREPVIGSLTKYKQGVLNRVTYFDGLGKASQNIEIATSSTYKDIVTHIETNERGHQVREYLPYPTSQDNGSMNVNALAETNSFYNTSKYQFTLNPFSEKVVEHTPEARVEEVASPGNSWVYSEGQVTEVETTIIYEGELLPPEFLSLPDHTQVWNIDQFLNVTGAQGTVKLEVSLGYKITLTFSGTGGFDLSDFAVDSGVFAGIYGLPDTDFGMINDPVTGGSSGRYIEIRDDHIYIRSAGFGNWTQGASFNHEYTASEDLPLSYVTKESSNHTLKKRYYVNEENEVKQYNVNFSSVTSIEDPSLVDNGYYPANELTKITTKDENWLPNQTYEKDNTIEEFTNKRGQVVLKRAYNENIAHDTYYVYDYLGNLTYVLPPKYGDGYTLPSEFDNYSQFNSYSDFVVNDGGGNGGVTTTIVNGVLSIEFNAQFTASSLISGEVVTIDTNPALPDMFVGSLDCETPSGTLVGMYDVSITNGSIKLTLISGGGDVIGFNQTITAGAINYDPQVVLDGIAYQYRYDDKNRLIGKKIPGKGWEYIVYDKLDRPVLIQDANQRITQEWTCTKYDGFGRVAYTGIFTNPDTETDAWQRRVNLQNTLTNYGVIYENRLSSPIVKDGMNLHYSCNSFPNDINSLELLSISYYDDYNFDTRGINNPNIVMGQQVTSSLKGLSTGTQVKVLGTTLWVTTVYSYDEKARLIYSEIENEFLDVNEQISNQLDFVGQVLKTRLRHKRDTDQEIVIQDTFLYDHVGRLIRQKQCIGDDSLSESCGDLKEEVVLKVPTTPQTVNATKRIRFATGFRATSVVGTDFIARLTDDTESELIAKNTYDELGQLVTKSVGNTTKDPLQNIDYKYNIRGWLTQINDPFSPDTEEFDLFNFAISYDQPTVGGTALFNGNISQTFWKTENQNDELRSYNYTYDALNRLTLADFTDHDNFSENDNYSEQLQYDKNGNITFLHRKGDVFNDVSLEYMDFMTYRYDGNQLQRVKEEGHNFEGFQTWINSTDTQTQYSYDENGNMLEDRNKRIENIEYNHLNLPSVITIGIDGNTIDKNIIRYTYDASGVKQQKVVEMANGSTTTTIYSGAYIYRFTDNNPINLQYIAQPEGYITRENGVFYYTYHYTDHLGNIRLSYQDSNENGEITSNEIVEEKNYYPFGMTHQGYNSVIKGTDYPFGYNGKEENEELGIDWINYGWRNYDASTGRWNGIDGMAEKYVSNSPYHYADNNPIRNYDINGNEFTDSAWDWVNRLIEEINSRQEKNNRKNSEDQTTLNQLVEENKGDSSKAKRLRRRIGRRTRENTDLERTRGEIAELEDSNQVYDVVQDAGGTVYDPVGNSVTTNNSSFNFSNSNFEITVSEGTSLGLFAHELKHAYQFEIGNVSFGSHGRGSRSYFFYDKMDEVEAYVRANLFGAVNSIRSINDLPQRYSDLPDGPNTISNHAEIQRLLRSNLSQQEKNRVLSNYARIERQAFRVNGVTYNGINNGR